MTSSVLFKPRFRKLALYLLPGILIYGFIVIIPIFTAFWQSLHRDIYFELHFTGLDNYVDLLEDEDFWFAFRNNLIILGVGATSQLVLAFMIALFISSKRVIMPRFFRTVLFFPVILSPLVVAFMWILIYDIDQGLLNSTFETLGLSSWQQLWLDDPDIVIYSVTVPLVWQFLGLFVIIFLAGLSSIPSELLEAAEIDGATAVQKARHVTLPLLANTWKVVLILAISGGVKVFELPFVMTGGGPGMSSTVLSQYAYNQSFIRSKLTYGSTVAIGMLVISLALIVLTIFILNKVVFRQGWSND